MRKILFRAKRIESGEWVKGCLLIDYVTGQYFIHAKGNSVNESIKVNEDGCLKFFAYEVDPETVCQYTGLTDRNGRKIFEGNIVRRKMFDGYIIGQVVWFDTGFCGFMLKRGNSYYHIGKSEHTGKVDCDEVIGNIYDNPELMER